MTGTLSAVGRSGIIQVEPGQSFTYVLTSTHEFIGTVQVRVSKDGTTWEPIVSKVGTVSAPLTTTIASGTVVNEGPARAWYDVAVLVYHATSDSVTYALVPVTTDLVKAIHNDVGDVVFEYLENGVRATNIEATNLLRTSTLIASSDIWLTGEVFGITHGSFPTTDPLVAGQVWSDSGVLTISAGPTPTPTPTT